MDEFRRNVDPTKRRQTNKSLFELENLQREYNNSKVEVKSAEQIHNVENEKLIQVTASVENARNALAAAQEEIDADYLPEGAQPRDRIDKRDRLALRAKQFEMELQAQKEATRKATENVVTAEQRLFKADKDLNRFAETLPDLKLAQTTIEKLDQEKARRLAEIELNVTKRKKKEEKMEKEAKEAQERELRKIQDRQMKVAKKLNAEARKKMAAANKETHELAVKMKELQTKQMEDRTEAVLELKANVNAVEAEVATLAQKHVKKVKGAEKRLENEKESLLAKGLNPYEEFRKQEMQSRAETKELRLRTQVDKNKAELAVRMEKEHKFLEKQEEKKRLAKMYEQKHRESQGRHVVEARNNDFIVSRTIGNVEILDPTGKAARVNPSQITEIPDFSFGLGKSSRIPANNMKNITQKIRESLNVDDDDLGEYGRLADGISKKLSAAKNDVAGAFAASLNTPVADADSVETAPVGSTGGISKKQLSQYEGLASRQGAMPGTDRAALALNLNDDKSEQQNLFKLAAEETFDDSKKPHAEVHAFKSPAYKPPVMSKFERHALDTAIEMHRDRIEYGTEQIAGGKLFQGDSFASKPAELIFQDFEVGKRYRKTFSLTNVSYTFNSFKLLDLEDSVLDFFIVTFEKPGRMSAGMNCHLEIVFTPQLNKDIFSSLRFLTETGPFEIPLRCLIKRCAPRITNPVIDFGPVVIGQKITLPLKIVNTQAIPTNFSIIPFAATQEVTEAVHSPEGVKLDLDGIDDFDDVDAPTGQDGEASSSPQQQQEGKEPKDEFINKSEQDKIVPELKEGMNGEGSGAVSPGEVAVEPIEEEPEELEDTGEEADHIGSEPAINFAELQARVRRVITSVVRHKRRVDPQPLSAKPDEGLVEGYNDTAVDIVYAPLKVGVIERNFSVWFGSVDESEATVDDLGNPVKREQIVTVRAYGEDVPVYVAEETMDFRCTLFDRIYRKKIVIQNRGNTAFRVTVKVPPKMSKYVEANPTLFFVQAKSSQGVHMKFTPMLEMLQKLTHFTLPYEDFSNSAVIALPIEIQAVNQEIPAYFVLRSSVCPSTVAVSCTQLDFGKIYVGQSTQQSFSLHNTSMLPQKVAFVYVRKELSIQPNDGFAVLLPNEVLYFNVTFSPLSAINYEFDLTLLTSFNDTYRIKVIAEGLEPPLSFSAGVIQMRTTSPGERVVASTLVTNETRYKQCFEVVLPDRRFTWLSVSPTVVELAPQKSCRLELEYLPATNALDLDPEQWHQQLKESVEGEEGVQTPFSEWRAETGWIMADGMFGGMQWVKQGVGFEENKEEKAEESEDKNKEVDNVAEVKENTEDGGESVEHAEKVQENDMEEETKEVVQEEGKPNPEIVDVPKEEWGIVGKWDLPILLRPRKKSVSAAASTITSPVARGSINSVSIDPQSKSQPLPLFLSVETAVVLPQLDADTKTLDFGQISLGIRQLRSFKIVNKTHRDMTLHSVGLNAVGPFSLIRPVKEIPAGETKVVIVECLPVQPGLMVEVIEFFNADAAVGGHRLRVTVKVHGLKPSIELTGLSPPPPSWNPRCGLLDFGHILKNDLVSKKFTISNKSTFAVDVQIRRVPGLGLPPHQQMELISRTSKGIPVFTIRPENLRIEQGTSTEIEVTFRPDRGRLQPFREDLDVMIGQTDEVLRVGLFGRSLDRQVFIRPDDPRDEPFANPFMKEVEDLQATSSNPTVRAVVMKAREALSLEMPAPPDLVLEFPDPYAPDVKPESYTEVDPSAAAPNSKAAKGTAPVASSRTGRQQVKRVMLGCVAPVDGRSGGPSTFEVVLSEEAKKSGLFSLSVEKGNIGVGDEVPLDVLCTLSKPRSLGGIFVGSWKSYSAEVSLKGGWMGEGEKDEKKVKIVLKAYVSI